MEELTGLKLRKDRAKVVYRYLFNSFAEYILRNTRVGEIEIGIKMVGKNINTFR